MKKNLKITLLLIIVLILTLNSCSKKVDESTFYDAMFAFNISLLSSDNPDEQYKVIKALWSDAQNLNSSGEMSDDELLCYEFGFLYTKFTLVVTCVNDNSLTNRLNTFSSELDSISTNSVSISELKSLINKLKTALGDYNRDFKYGELSSMCGK